MPTQKDNYWPHLRLSRTGGSNSLEITIHLPGDEKIDFPASISGDKVTLTVVASEGEPSGEKTKFYDNVEDKIKVIVKEEGGGLGGPSTPKSCTVHFEDAPMMGGN